jgi:HK97 gp10 family phage protein
MPRRYRLDKLEMPELEEILPRARRKIMRAGVKIIALKVRQIAPDSGVAHKGKLRKTITYQVLQGGLQGVVAAKAPHAHLVHNGTKAHEVPAPKDPAKFRAVYRFHPGGRPAQHPGSRPQPFMTDAAEQTRGEVERAMKQATEEAMREVVG